MLLGRGKGLKMRLCFLVAIHCCCIGPAMPILYPIMLAGSLLIHCCSSFFFTFYNSHFFLFGTLNLAFLLLLSVKYVNLLFYVFPVCKCSKLMYCSTICLMILLSHLGIIPRLADIQMQQLN